MKTLILAPTVIAATLFGMTLPQGADAPATDDAPSPGDLVETRGVVQEWRLDRDGSVLFRIAAQSEDAKALWFRCPSSRNADTHVELQLTMLLLETRARPGCKAALLSVIGEADSDERGASPESALDLVSVSLK